MADSASWIFGGPSGTVAASVVTRVGCQPYATAGGAGVYSLTQVQLENSAVAPTALETDPNGFHGSLVTGDYTFTATVPGEVFRAYVGFCSGEPLNAEMQYEVTNGTGGSQPPLANGPLIASSGQLTYVNVALPAGTTQLALVVQNSGPTFPYGDVVWIDPTIESGNAPPPPSPAPGPTALPPVTPSR
jgi:hypothetical protein